MEDDPNNDTIFKCDIDDCMFTTKYKASLTRHKKNKHGNEKMEDEPNNDKEFKCDIDDCPFTTKYKASLTRHKNAKHLGKKPHHCDTCGKDFAQSGTLKEHMRTHIPEDKKHKRGSCEMAFYTSTDLKRHEDAVHKNIRNHQCDKCPKKFQTASDLSRHVRDVHEKIRDHQCPHCDASFSTTTHLREHMKRIHEKIRDHQCENCPKSFSTATELRGHTKTHSQDKPYLCSFCGKNYKNLSSLNDHVNYNHNSDPALQRQCGYCNYKCRDKYLLRSHKLRCHEHVNETMETLQGTRKIHRCEFCGKNFSEGRDMRKHVANSRKKAGGTDKEYECKRATGGITVTKKRVYKEQRPHPLNFPCFLCNEIFPSMDQVKAHIESEHEGVADSNTRWISGHGATESGSYCCYWCGAGFESYVLSKRHIATCLKFKGYTPRHGHLGRKTKRTRKRRVSKFRTHANPDEIKFPCFVCDAVYESFENIKDHIDEKHGTDRPWNIQWTETFAEGESGTYLCYFNGTGWGSRMVARTHLKRCVKVTYETTEQRWPYHRLPVNQEVSES